MIVPITMGNIFYKSPEERKAEAAKKKAQETFAKLRKKRKSKKK